ncbi:MAG: cytochrome c peroxidase [Planctomycetota bacterium]|nr:cytochrome c peroxidase [Planctomycetota bacterium]
MEMHRSGRTSARRGAIAVLGVAPAALGTAAALSLLARADLPPVPVPPQNPLTEDKRVLGKVLFWDEQLSTSNIVSCGTCHSPARGGADPRIARHPGRDGIINTPDDVLGSPGIIRSDADNDFMRDDVFGLNPQITTRAANSMINAAFAPELFWDGRARSQFVDPQTGQVVIPVGGALESQAAGPPVSSVEMAHDGFDWDSLADKLAGVNPLDLATNVPADVQAALADRPSYQDLFRRAFGDAQITASRIAMAIATYERTLIADQTPFDAFRDGVPGAMTPAQVRGFNAFTNVNAARCSLCHSVATDQFTDHTFRNIGLRPIAEDPGRQSVTGNPADAGRFKVPSLRNVALKPTFMHNGQFNNLADVMRFYAGGPPAQFPQNRDPIMPLIQLPPNAAADVQAFLTALTDPRVASQTFPFDRPLLAGDRPAQLPALVGGGSPGTGGIVPRIIAQTPAMIGMQHFRIGLDGALGGASATLVLSFTPPTNGRVSADIVAGSTTAQGVGAGLGLGTLHWPISPRLFDAGDVVYAQWIVQDPAAPGGEARSVVARLPMFCGLYGCPPSCVPDFNADGNVDQDDIACLAQAVAGDASCSTSDPDFNADGNVDQDDLAALEQVVAGGACP